MEINSSKYFKTLVIAVNGLMCFATRKSNHVKVVHQRIIKKTKGLDSSVMHKSDAVLQALS